MRCTDRCVLFYTPRFYESRGPDITLLDWFGSRLEKVEKHDYTEKML